MRAEEYAEHDALGLADLVRRGEVSPGELVECALAAHEQVDGVVNSVVAMHPDRARDDVDLTGPLAGVPYLVKDLFHGAVGLPCGNGSRLSADWRVARSSQIVERAAAAGMRVVGRSTTSEFGVMGTTETIAQGITSSPWSPQHMAGGSSGGAAASVGAGIVPVALASDGGGSIRIPASACGVVGLKPSRGRVPWGLRSKEPLLGWAVQFAVSRTVRDTAAMLDALGGPTPGDPEGMPRPATSFLASLDAPPPALRVAWWTDPWSGHAPDPDVTSATQRTAELLVDLGHRVEQASPRFDWDPYLTAMTDVWASTTAHTIDGFAAALDRPVSADTLEGATLQMVEHGRQVTAAQLLSAIDAEMILTSAMNAFFREYDVLLTPTLAAVPPRVGLYDPVAPTPPRETLATWSRWECFLPVFNTTGLPAISLPLHMSEGGLPLGMQFVAAIGREGTLLRLAGQLEEALPWRDRRPAAFPR